MTTDLDTRVISEIAPDVPNTPEGILAAARAAAPELAKRREEIEQARRLPPDIVELVRSTGVFRMGFSAEYGGPDLTSVQQTEVIEALAYGDTATGWCAMIGMDTGIYAGYLERSAAQEIMPHIDMITAGLIFPAGKARRVEGGYRLSGRWGFGSGITHADLVIAGAFIVDADGKPENGPNGVPATRVFFLTPDQVTIEDTWYTTGLRGSGSNHYNIDDVFVPERRAYSFGKALSRSGPMSMPDAIVRNMPGVPLGTMRAALDYARAEIGRRTVPTTGQPWHDNYRIQRILGECEMEYQGIRNSVYGSLNHQWERLSRPGATLDDLSADERISTMLPRLNAFRVARQVITKLYDLLGTSSIYAPSPMDRWLRDVNTMCTHIVVGDHIIQSAGAHLLGGTPEFPFALGIVED
jgi:alkylation response protein AidB-like acyl-CoA dehydrogenase